MMTNLFSTFDPMSSMNLPLNWMSSMLILIFTTLTMWLIPNRTAIYNMKLINILHTEFKMLIPNKLNKGSTMIFISLMLFIMMNNFLGLFPFIFTSSSHLSFTLGLALPLWMTFMIYGWINHMQHMFTHLVPQGTPNILMPFMVLIETISNIIRPITLSVRLAANMIAGHLLLTLLGNTGPLLMNSMMMIQMLIMSQILLLILEIAVSIIQSYVFAVLTTLYSSETN